MVRKELTRNPVLRYASRIWDMFKYKLSSAYHCRPFPVRLEDVRQANMATGPTFEGSYLQQR